jgi:hypothetical protein
MPRDPVAQRVADELNGLMSPGSELHLMGPRASVRLFTPTQLARRTVEIAVEYRRRSPFVASDGLAAVVTAGPPGAGKSTYLEAARFKERGFREIDADEIKDMLLSRAILERTFDDILLRTLADGRPIRPRELSSLVHAESTAIAQNLVEISTRAGENVVVHGTLGWEGQPNSLLSLLSENGYEELTIIDVEVDLPSAIERTLDRWWLGRVDEYDFLGGRFVPEGSIRSLYTSHSTSRCSANADFMFATAQIPCELRRVSTNADSVTTSVTRKE